MPSADLQTWSFKQGDEVPDWLIVTVPQCRVTFDCNCFVSNENGGYHIYPLSGPEGGNIIKIHNETHADILIKGGADTGRRVHIHRRELTING